MLYSEQQTFALFRIMNPWNNKMIPDITCLTFYLQHFPNDSRVIVVVYPTGPITIFNVT